jgi:hypothetical protein
MLRVYEGVGTFRKTHLKDRLKVALDRLNQCGTGTRDFSDFAANSVEERIGRYQIGVMCDCRE